MVDIKQLATVRLGEGPHWDPTNRCLLFVDIINGDLHRYYPATKVHQKLHIENVNTGSMVGFVLPVEGRPDLLVVGLGRSFAVVEWPLDSKETIAKPCCVLHSVEGHEPNNRFNDGKCDPSGRIWAGTMAQESRPAVLEKEKGALYCLNTDLSLATTVSKITLSNGLAWSGDKKTFYYIDSLAYSVDAFDYDDAKGKISNRRVLLNFKAAGLVPDVPDGMCTDQEGNIWVACFSGKKKRIKPLLENPNRQVDLVSCQFAFHYCFESLAQAETMLRNVSENLKRGGFFIATLPNAYEIMSRLKNSENNRFGNEVCKIQFPEDRSSENANMFGDKYNFFLEGVVDCPEFLVHPPTLIRLAKKWGLQLEWSRPFSEVYKDALKDSDAQRLLSVMHALENYPSRDPQATETESEYSHAKEHLTDKEGVNYIRTLTSSEWEALCIYQAWVFRKMK